MHILGFSFCFILLSLLNVHVAAEDDPVDPIIETSYGKLRGSSQPWHNGKTVAHFKKVPFAKPPLKELRWALPRPPQPWNEVLDAREYGAACMSNSSTTKSPQKWVDEDCLHINVFTNQDCLNWGNCSVAFYIHGGGFQYDSAVMFNDSMIMETFASRDVVFITAGFRLGFFSHLIFEGDDVVHKNIAVYDLLAALEFTHSEARPFGGDKSKVTLFGHSYGGGAAVELALSPKIDPKRRLFQRVVAMSPGIIFSDVGSLNQLTMEFVRRSGCSPPVRRPPFNRHFRETHMLRCLRTKDQFELLKTQREMEDEGTLPPGYIIRDGILFSKGSLVDFLAEGQPIPMLIGSTSREMDFDPDPQPAALDNALFTEFDFQNPNEIQKKFAFDWLNNRLEYNHTFETQYLFQSIMLTASSISDQGDTVYLYSYQNPKHPKHTDDLYYLLGIHAFEEDKDEKQLASFYRQMFTDYIKTGNPAENFEKFDVKLANYLYIDINETSGLRPHMENNYENEVISYWKKMHAYDKSLTGSKMKAWRNKAIEIVPSEFATSSTRFYRTAALFVSIMFFLLGFCLARCYFLNKRREFIVLDGDNRQYEKLPLYSNLI